MHTDYAETLVTNPYVQAIEPHEAKQQAMLANGELVRLGALAILVSNRGNDGTYSANDFSHFMSGAEAYQQNYTGQYQEIRIIPELTTKSIREALRDRANAAVAVASHGFIDGVITSDNGELYTWEDVAEDTTHLKAEFFQITCGYYRPTQEICVPVGTFAVSKLSGVHAAPGVILPVGLKDASKVTKVVRPILTDDEDLAEQLARLHQKHYRTRIMVDENGEVTRVIKRM